MKNVTIIFSYLEIRIVKSQ